MGGSKQPQPSSGPNSHLRFALSEERGQQAGLNKSGSELPYSKLLRRAVEEGGSQ